MVVLHKISGLCINENLGVDGILLTPFVDTVNDIIIR